MQNQNDQNERARPRLESAMDLKGRKAKQKAKKSIGKKWALTLVSLAVVLGLVIGAYYLADFLKPVAEPEETTDPTSEMVTLIDREKNDLDRLTIYENGQETYTIVSNLKQKAEAAAAAATAAPESTALPTPEELESAQTQTETGEAAPDEEQAEPKELPDYEIEGMPWFEVDASVAKSPAVYSYALTASRQIEENCADLSKYGLANPQLRVVYKYHDGTQTTLNVGDKVVAGNYYYVTLDDDTNVYMAYKNVYTYYANDLAALHVVPVATTVSAENIRDITISQRGKETVQMKYIDDGSENISITLLKLVQPFAYDTNSDRSTEIIEASASLTITAYAGYAPDEETRAEYGLADPYAEISLSDADGASRRYVIGDLLPGNDAYRYVTIDDTGNVYTLETALIAYLSNVRASYVVDQFTNLVFINRITGFEIQTKDTTYTAGIERVPYIDENGKEQNAETFFYEGAQTDEDLFKDFYQVVIGTLFDKRMDNEEDYHFDGDVFATLRYHLTYTDEPFVVEYIDYDRDYYAIRRDGLTLFLIRKDKIANLIDTAELYRNGEFLGDEQ